MRESFALQLSMHQHEIITNASEILAQLPARLKVYDYLVSEDNYRQAKKDRRNLNKLVKQLKAKRQEFEQSELGEWMNTRKTLMEIEQLMQEASRQLSEGIHAVEASHQQSHRQALILRAQQELNLEEADACQLYEAVSGNSLKTEEEQYAAMKQQYARHGAVEVITARMQGNRLFFDALNQLVEKYHAQVEILERKEKEGMLWK